MYQRLTTLIKQEVGLDPAQFPFFFLTVFMKRRMTNNNLITAAAKKTEENFSHQIRDMKGRSHLN